MALAEVEADTRTGQIAEDTTVPPLLTLTAHSSRLTDSSPHQHMVLISLPNQHILRSSSGTRSMVSRMQLNLNLTLR